MATTTATQWPLSAAATDVLMRLPSLGTPRVKGSSPELLKLAIKELLIRRSMDVVVEKPGFRKQRVRVQWRPAPGPLPVPLGTVDHALRSAGGDGELSKIVKNARKRHPGLQAQVLAETVEYLAAGGLAVKERQRVLGIFSTELWRRTPLGDQWAESAQAHHDALATQLPALAPSRPDQAAMLLAGAGALILFVPGTLAAVAGIRERFRQTDFAYYQMGADLPDYGFDVIGGVGDAFDTIASGFDGAIDAVAGAVDSVIDSVGSSIDGAIDSAVDAGGGGCGSGGDSGGSSCGGGCGGGGCGSSS